MSKDITSKTRWTKDQQKVIEARGKDLLVSAAAGSGKTAVLVERILKLITDEKDPMDVDRMLIVTFTRAAAAEMKSRVREALKKEISTLSRDPKGNPAALAHLKNQELMVNNAQISTIHSFCSGLIKNHFHEIGLDPAYHMASEGETKLLKKQAMERVFTSCYEASDPAFLHFIDTYAAKSGDENCMDMIFRLYELSQSAPWPMEWLQSLLVPYEADSAESLYQADCLKSALVSILRSFAAVRKELAALLPAMKKPEMKPYEEVLCADLADLDDLLSCKDLSQLGICISQISFQKLPGKRLSEEAALIKERYKASRDRYKDALLRVKKNYFSVPCEQTLAAIKSMKPIAEELIALTILFDREYAELKRKKNALDFSDLEHFALDILRESQPPHKITDTAKALQAYYRTVMVDEYQDSNRIQEELIHSVCPQDSRFAVGDIKQSIYRFRMAEPSIFREMMEEYETDPNRQRIDLSLNFRSREQVLDFTNELFSSLMGLDLGGVEYDEQAALHYGAEYYEPDPQMDVEVLLADSDDDDREELEALIIAERIERMVGKTMIYDKDIGDRRPLQYSDIVILLRSPKTNGAHYTQVLKEAGVPIVMLDRDSYYDTVEVANLLNILRVIDNPYQDLPLVSVLKNFFGFSNDILADIRANSRGGSFADAFFAYAVRHDQQAEVKTFLAFLEKYRRAKEDTPLHVLIGDILITTGYQDKVSCLPGGAYKRENLRQLVDQAIAFEQGSFSGVFSFLNYIEQLKKYQIEYGIVNNTGEKDNTVKLLTIHKSKGLEFPVVFVSNLGSNFNTADKRGNMIVEAKAGLGLRTFDEKRRTKSDNLLYGAVKESVDAENLGEEMRVLYVALTRAREKLFLTGYYSRDTAVKTKERLQGLNPETFQLDYVSKKTATSYLDWIIPILAVKNPQKIMFCDRESLALIRKTENQLLGRNFDDLHPSEEAGKRLEDLKKRLKFCYPYEPSSYKSKYSVSELKHRAIDKAFADEESCRITMEETEDSFEPLIPSFLSEEGKSSVQTRKEAVPPGALRGTAFHRYMECLNFKVLPAAFAETTELYAFYEAEKERMVSLGLLDDTQASLLMQDRIIAFMTSDLAQRMAAADRRGDLHKEQPFVMGGKPEDFFSLVDSAIVKSDDGFCLMQGIIDAYFEEGDAIILMDYKTDRAGTHAELVNKYEAQLRLYAMALNRIGQAFGKKVSEILIYSTSLNDTIPLEV